MSIEKRIILTMTDEITFSPSLDVSFTLATIVIVSLLVVEAFFRIIFSADLVIGKAVFIIEVVVIVVIFVL